MFNRKSLHHAQPIRLSDLITLGVPASSVAEFLDEFETDPVFPFNRPLDDGLIEI